MSDAQGLLFWFCTPVARLVILLILLHYVTFSLENQSNQKKVIVVVQDGGPLVTYKELNVVWGRQFMEMILDEMDFYYLLATIGL